jgi:type I restriction enzyme S subunit
VTILNKINYLIQSYCPNGVEYRPLESIATKIYRGSGIRREQLNLVGIPCVRYGEIYTSYNIWFDHCLSKTDPQTINPKRYFEHGDILFAITGESVDEIAKSCTYIGYEKCLAGGDIVVMKHKQSPKYLSYALSTTDAQKQKSQGKIKNKVVHISIPDILKIIIPLPPLHVQEEIVRILDKFSELQPKLQAELQAELQARKRQYEYYRKSLLSFEGREDVQWLSLKEVALNVFSGATPLVGNSNYYGGTIPWLRTQEVRFNDIFDTEIHITSLAVEETATKWLPKDCIIIAISGATAGRSAINKIPLTTNQHCCCFEINPKKANYKYVFHWVSSQYLSLKGLGQGARGDLNSTIIKNFFIPVPSIDEQNKIVSILDTFDTLTTDLITSLSIEIHARRKQYEYYRDKLLTFEKTV